MKKLLMKNIFYIATFSILSVSNLFPQSYTNKIEDLLKEIVEINFYTSKSETQKLLDFLDKENFIKQNSEDTDLQYFKLYSDKKIDYIILFKKESIEFILTHESSSMNWESYQAEEVLQSIHSLMGLPNHMFDNALDKFLIAEKEKASKFQVVIISDNEFRVINEKETSYKKSNFSNLGFESDKILDKNGKEVGYRYEFGYLYPDGRKLLYLKYFCLIQENNEYVQWFEVPIKQINISKETNFNPSLIK